MNQKTGKIEKKIIMMQSKFLNRTVLVIILVMLCCIASCSVDESNVSANNSADNITGDYTISFRSFSYSDDFAFNIIKLGDELREINNSSAMETVNESIENAMTSWIGGKVVNASAQYINIYCHSERYLSFANVFTFTSRRVDHIYDYITIDLQTGKRVMLNDLVDINMDFVNHIQENKIVKATNREIYMDSGAEDLWEYLSKMDASELLEKLEECSLTQEEVIAKGYAPIEGSIGPLVSRNSFFIRDNDLVIVLHDGDVIYLTFNFDDIAEYLKVDL